MPPKKKRKTTGDVGVMDLPIVIISLVLLASKPRLNHQMCVMVRILTDAAGRWSFMINSLNRRKRSILQPHQLFSRGGGGGWRDCVKSYCAGVY